MRRPRTLILLATVLVIVAATACLGGSGGSTVSDDQTATDSSPNPIRTPIPTTTGDSDTPRPVDDQVGAGTVVNPTAEPRESAGSSGGSKLATNTPTPSSVSGGSGRELSPVSVPTREITFNLTVPTNTPAEDPVFLTIMDFASGVTERVRMTQIGDGTYEVKANVFDNAMIRYTYDRFEYKGVCCLEETLRESLGESFRFQYRFLLTQPDVTTVNDSIATWADRRIPYEEGQITGFVIDSQSGEPVLDADVSISGVHVATRVDGSFKVPRLPAGEHSVIVHSNTGDFNPVQKIVTLEAGGTVAVDFTITNTRLVPVAFDVTLPDTTPKDAWVKLAGNIYSLGGRIGHPGRPLSPDNYFIPRIERDGDRASAKFMLPVGAFIEYFYTIGPIGSTDETAEQGRRVRRSFVVGDDGDQRIDNVQNWANEGWPLITLRLIPPVGTPPNTPIALNMGPSSWMEPRSDGTYTTVLGSVPPGGTVSYRYLLGDEFNGADGSEETVGGLRTITVPDKSGEVVDVVTRWAGQRDPSARQENGSLAVTFRVSVPPETPADAKIFLVGNRPALGSGVEMKALETNPWMYEAEVVFGHDGRLAYNFELRSEGGIETLTREIDTNFDGQVVNDWIVRWPGISPSIAERDGFVKGYYPPDLFSNGYIALSESTYARARTHEGSAVVISSVWSYGQSQPIPTLEYRGVHAGSVATPLEDILLQARMARDAGLEIFFGPQFNMEQAPGGFDVYNGPKSDEWWVEWLKLADEMWTWQATVAEMIDAEYMMLPGPLFHVYDQIDRPDDHPTIRLIESEQTRLIEKVRSIYSGTIVITGSADRYKFPGLADFNGVTTYDVGVPQLPSGSTVDDFVEYYEGRFVERVDPIFERWGNPVFFYTIHAPSIPTADDPSGEIGQATALEALFRVISSRPEIIASLSWSYSMIDAPLIPEDGVRGRMGEAVLAKWYAILGG